MNYYFQNVSTDLALDILYLNDYIQFYLLLMIIAITYVYIFLLFSYLTDIYNRYAGISLIDFTHGMQLEIYWTLLPAFILFLIAIPGFNIVYDLDVAIGSCITVKCIGSQWYWSYQVTDSAFECNINNSFDSYMVPYDSLQVGDLRLLEVDNALLLPVNKTIRLIITSTDVIHSFSVPSLGVKLDAIPGRLNQTSININRYGQFYGACQEICGIQHAFMPIKIIGTTYFNFISNIFANI